jgi:hypothetical protein
MFKSLIVCEGTFVAENQYKIRFRQDYVDCWIKKTDLEKLEMLGITFEGDKACRITVSEDLANLMELQGVLE